jgi:hypothetical protein
MDMICISETWLKKHQSDKKFRMNGFKLVASFYDPPKNSSYSLYGAILEDLISKYEDNLFLGGFKCLSLSQHARNY